MDQEQREELLNNLLTMEDQAERSQALEQLRSTFISMADSLVQAQETADKLTLENTNLIKANSNLFNKLGNQDATEKATEDLVDSEDNNQEPEVQSVEDILE